MLTDVAYYILLAATLLALLGFVTTKDIVRAAGYLLIVLALVAAVFAFMGSLLLSMIQLLVYAGAVIVLFLFGVMLTRRETPTSRLRQLASAENLLYLVFAILLYVLITRSALGLTTPIAYLSIDPKLVGLSLYVEFRGVVYALAALIGLSSVGAIYIVRREKKQASSIEVGGKKE